MKSDGTGNTQNNSDKKLHKNPNSNDLDRGEIYQCLLKNGIKIFGPSFKFTDGITLKFFPHSPTDHNRTEATNSLFVAHHNGYRNSVFYHLFLIFTELYTVLGL